MSTRNKDVIRKVSKLSTLPSKTAATSSRIADKEKKEKTEERKLIKEKVVQSESSRSKPVKENIHKGGNGITSSRATKKVNADASKAKTEPKNGLSRTNVSSTKKPSSTTTLAKTRKTSLDTPSSRVTKTQYFPSKNMISNVVKAERSRRNSQVESPQLERKASKKVEYDSSSDTSLSVDRPRTATLRKGSVVNMNIAGPDVPRSSKKPLKLSNASDTEEYTYEDDFESYESDFEEYNSSSKSSISEELTAGNSPTTIRKSPNEKELEDDRKLDSGTFDLPEYKHKHILDNIKESVEKENNLMLDNKSNLGSLSDEGFEEGKSMQGVPFINFFDAQKRYKKRKSLEKKRKRGEELMSMIKLDIQSFTVLDMAPIPYSNFIQMYGTNNTLQIGTQTGDDNISEETQTDTIETCIKWTQFPVVISKIDENNENYMEKYKKEYLGVGSDDACGSSIKSDDLITSERLNAFVSVAGKLISSIIMEKNQYSLGNINSLSNVPFSNGFVQFNTNDPLLRNRSVLYVSFSPTQDCFLTVHENLDDDYDDKSGVHMRSIVCLWNVYNSEEPEKMLTMYGSTVCAAFGSFGEFLYAGAKDGTISVWDINNTLDCEKIEFGTRIWNLPLPNHTTDICFAHSFPVVSVQPVSDSQEDVVFKNNGLTSKSSKQICSLDEEGTVVIWAVISKNTTDGNAISLVKNCVINLREYYPELIDMSCTDMLVHKSKSNHIFISTNYGYILHCLSSGDKGNPSKYSPGLVSIASCLASCPFSSEYFLVGHEDGNIFLYSTAIEKCLKTLNNKASDNEECKIELLEWSFNKPFILYSVDHNNVLHIWDLESSDIFPIYSVPFKEKINYIKLSPSIISKEKVSKRSYMIIVSENGSIHLHLLNGEHGPQSFNTFEEDVKKFLNYVNRL